MDLVSSLTLPRLFRLPACLSSPSYLLTPLPPLVPVCVSVHPFTYLFLFQLPPSSPIALYLLLNNSPVPHLTYISACISSSLSNPSTSLLHLSPPLHPRQPAPVNQLIPVLPRVFVCKHRCPFVPRLSLLLLPIHPHTGTYPPTRRCLGCVFVYVPQSLVGL